MRRGWLRIVVAVLLLLPVPAFADGMFFPERVRPVPLRIPAQRALLVFRNGVETLTVESTLDAKGQSFGWVVPVPAKPTAVEKATRGPLDLLDAATEPEVVHDRGLAHGATAWIFLFLAFLLLSRAALVRWEWSSRSFVGVALCGFLLLFLPLGFRTLAGSAGGGGFRGLALGHESVPGVRAGPTQRVGAYEVTVLQAEDGGALGRWLESSGFAGIPEGGRPVVDAHVREGWSFVAVRLAREEEGRAAPHPLRIAFPAREPVYPMRLTALAGGTTSVRLYVVADEGRAAPGLVTIFRDRLRLRPATAGNEGVARGQGLGGILAHPRLLPDLWDGCVLTHLDGTFRPSDMDRDLVLGAGSSEPLLARFWSEEGARDTAAAWTLVPWAALAFILLFVPPDHLPMRGRTGSPFLPCLLALSAAAGGAFLLIRGALPIVEVMVVREREQWIPAPGEIMTHWLPGQQGPDFAAMSSAEVAEFLRPRIAIGDSPGEAEVLDRPAGRVVRFYAETGEPTDWTIPAGPPGIR